MNGHRLNAAPARATTDAGPRVPVPDTKGKAMTFVDRPSSASLTLRRARRGSTAAIVAVVTSLLIVVTGPPAFAELNVVWGSSQIAEIHTAQPPNGEDFKGRFYVTSLSTAVPEDSRIQLTSTPLTGTDPVWTTKLLVPGSDPSSSIAIKTWQSRLWLAFRAQNSKIYYSSSANGTSWASWASIAGSEGGYGAPALKGIGSKLYIAGLNESHRTEIANRTITGSWSTFTTVPGLTSAYRPALTEFQNKLTLAIIGADGRVHLNTSTNGASWKGWTFVPDYGQPQNWPSSLVASAGPGLTVFKDQLYVGVRIGDDNGDAYLNIITYNGRTWTNWDSTPPFGQTIDGDPCLTTAAGDLFLVTQGLSSDRPYLKRLD